MRFRTGIGKMRDNREHGGLEYRKESVHGEGRVQKGVSAQVGGEYRKESEYRLAGMYREESEYRVEGEYSEE